MIVNSNRIYLAHKDPNLSTPYAQLYNEAFTSCAKVIPRCPNCLCEDHAGATCPHNPNPVVFGWLHEAVSINSYQSAGRGYCQEICRNFNENWCRFICCRFAHSCLECFGPHPAIFCPHKTSPPTGGVLTRGWLVSLVRG